MKLSFSDLEAIAESQENTITADEIKTIFKKSGEKGLKVFFRVLSVIILAASICSWIWKREFPLFCMAFFFFCQFMSENTCQLKNLSACYGTVVDKTVRCARLSSSTIYLPFEKTAEAGTFKHRFSLSKTVQDFYFCSVEINGQIFEHVCCYRKDYPNLRIGDKVIVANDTYLCPVVYGCSKN